MVHRVHCELLYDLKLYEAKNGIGVEQRAAYLLDLTADTRKSAEMLL